MGYIHIKGAHKLDNWHTSKVDERNKNKINLLCCANVLGDDRRILPKIYFIFIYWSVWYGHCYILIHRQLQNHKPTKETGR